MFSRRIRMAVLSAMLLSALTAAPAAAAKPIRPPPRHRPPRSASHRSPPSSWPRRTARSRPPRPTWRPSRPAAATSSGSDCVVPTGTDGRRPRRDRRSPRPRPAPSRRDSSPSRPGTRSGATTAARPSARSSRTTRGPWGPGGNKFTQGQLAGWMGTDANGGTSSQALANGLEVATRGAPRRPAVWTWVVTPLLDNDRDGHVGDELHGFIRANVSGSRMPLAFSLKPHDPSAVTTS